jgi:hypothetical protein
MSCADPIKKEVLRLCMAHPSLPRIVWIIIVDLPTGFNHEQKNSNANPGYHREHEKKYFHDVAPPREDDLHQ